MTRRLEKRIAASLELSRKVMRLVLRRIAREAAGGRTDAAAIEMLIDAAIIRGRILQISDDYAAQNPRTNKKESAP